MNEPVEIGEVTFYESETRLWIEIAEQQSATLWTVEGAKAAVAYLQQWIAQQEGQV